MFKPRAGSLELRNIESLAAEMTPAAYAAAFEQAHRLYQDSFPDPTECEPIEAVREILAFNHDAGMQARHGPYHECFAVFCPQGGTEIVGGLVFGVTTSETHLRHGYFASAQCIFIFLSNSKAVRGHVTPGYIRTWLTKAAARVTEDLIAAGKLAVPEGMDWRRLPCALFFEVNNPLVMTDAQARDDLATGISPCERYQFWLDCRCQPLDFLYLQPALREGVAPVMHLDLFMQTADAAPVPAALLLAHLRPFMAISVLKGRVMPEQDTAYLRMLLDLKLRGTVGFVAATDPRRQRIAALLAAGAAWGRL